MKGTRLLLGVALAGSAAIAIFGDRSHGDDVPVEPTVHQAPRASDSSGATFAMGAESSSRPPASGAAPEERPRAAVTVAALRPRAELMKHATAQIFASQTFDPPPLPAPKAPPPMFAASASAPPSNEPPPLPFTYLGKKLENQKWEIWLALGDQTLYVREGSVLERGYVVNSIKPPLLTLTYLPLKKMQTMTIGGAE